MGNNIRTAKLNIVVVLTDVNQYNHLYPGPIYQWSTDQVHQSSLRKILYEHVQNKKKSGKHVHIYFYINGHNKNIVANTMVSLVQNGAHVYCIEAGTFEDAIKFAKKINVPIE